MVKIGKLKKNYCRILLSEQDGINEQEGFFFIKEKYLHKKAYELIWLNFFCFLWFLSFFLWSPLGIKDPAFAENFSCLSQKMVNTLFYVSMYLLGQD